MMHPSLTKAAVSATAAMAEVQAAANYLAEVMHRIHGVKFDIDISHVSLFILIANRTGDAPITPRPEGV